jgi:hypothetical protein
MSIRLSEGLRLRDSTSDLFTVIPAMAAAVRKELIKASVKVVGEELASACDDAALRSAPSPMGSFRFTVEQAWRKQQESFGRSHRLNDPLRFSMVFGRTSTGAMLAYPFYEHRGYAAAIKSTRLFEPYGYWNNSDEPRGMSKSAWRARQEEWAELTDEHDTFGTLPLWALGEESNPWTTVYLHPPKRQDLNSYRSQEMRRRRALVNAVAVPLLERYGRDSVMRALREADHHVTTFLATPEGQALPLPETLPRTFSFRESALPPLYEVAEETVTTILNNSPEKTGTFDAF